MGREVGQGKMNYLQISQSAGKYTTPKTFLRPKIYKLLRPAVSAVGLDLPSSIHAFGIGNKNWMAQPASLHPAPTNATTQASSPSSTHYYLVRPRHWCSGARNAVTLVCPKSKIREKTDLGTWGRSQAQSGDWGRLSGCFLTDQRDQGESRL